LKAKDQGSLAMMLNCFEEISSYAQLFTRKFIGVLNN
jgi:hypothetical protein